MWHCDNQLVELGTVYWLYLLLKFSKLNVPRAQEMLQVETPGWGPLDYIHRGIENSSDEVPLLLTTDRSVEKSIVSFQRLQCSKRWLTWLHWFCPWVPLQRDRRSTDPAQSSSASSESHSPLSSGLSPPLLRPRRGWCQTYRVTTIKIFLSSDAINMERFNVDVAQSKK